jgi:radical SAM protein (TIGR01212 family)
VHHSYDIIRGDIATGFDGGRQKMESPRLYRDFNSYLREVFGFRVQKIAVDAGLTCPNRDGSISYGGCIYCNERGSGTGAANRTLTIKEQLEMGKVSFARRYKAKKFLAYFQSFSNTYGPLSRLKMLYAEALGVEDVVGLSIGTRPDCVRDEVLDHLEELSRERLIWIEYGLQSANDVTLIRINRGHNTDAFLDAVRRTRARKLPICVHVILGLPGESRKDMLETARFLASQDIQAVKIHLLYVIRGTILEQWYRAGTFECLSSFEYISIVAEFLALLPPHVIIQRLTGDPHPEELVAPAWALEKRQNIEAIHTYMKSHNLYQGKFDRMPKCSQ